MTSCFDLPSLDPNKSTDDAQKNVPRKTVLFVDLNKQNIRHPLVFDSWPTMKQFMKTAQAHFQTELNPTILVQQTSTYQLAITSEDTWHVWRALEMPLIQRPFTVENEMSFNIEMPYETHIIHLSRRQAD